MGKSHFLAKSWVSDHIDDDDVRRFKKRKPCLSRSLLPFLWEKLAHFLGRQLFSDQRYFFNGWSNKLDWNLDIFVPTWHISASFILLFCPNSADLTVFWCPYLFQTRWGLRWGEVCLVIEVLRKLPSSSLVCARLTLGQPKLWLGEVNFFLNQPWLAFGHLPSSWLGCARLTLGRFKLGRSN